MHYHIVYKRFGDRAILIEWPKEISTSILRDILNFKEKLSIDLHKDILETRSAYNSLLVVYNKVITSFKETCNTLTCIYKQAGSLPKQKSTLWKIPVCYDFSFGLDLRDMAKAKQMSVSNIIEHHTAAIYTVYFLGFLPGFMYLGGLDKVLKMPRKSMPRMKIEKGAVAIGGDQTGVYPMESPGGWNIIGNTPINFFNVANSEPCFVNAGDTIKFYAVSQEEYNDIKVLVQAGVYQLTSKMIDD
ncbi:5-oxoprolinase subunit PxpB [Tamlana fucoidanivorans]|uniref:5-oxoprolinase subunit PxpB n=1 Tax=Allotamlana fucoidanivorans TaxID=2583814 RepID=A0A5C4SJ68_9FLAO|nr:5-oxoprolinase subunit PxpB [Tamlana fucoidanivorans]TNJ42966.1 5-oxoprolinase subunit PxpB [Tamlana fucoidanivorans]